MKVCFKCKEELPLFEFYKHKQMADGHLNKCKSCAKKDAIDNRWKNIDRIRAYDRARGSRQDKAYRDWYRDKYPNKYKAQTMVSNAARDGKLTKPTQCEFCGTNNKLHGHHADYSKPLDVQWLCAPCHRQWHIKHGEGINGGNYTF